MIQTENLSFKVGDKVLVEHVSIHLTPGRMHIILGANGAGKSTLIKLLSGQLKPTSGSVSYDQKDIASIKTNELARTRAVLSQSVEFVFPLSVPEVVMMGRYPHFQSSPRKRDQEVVTAAMEQFDITDLAERDYNTLSGGEKQRVQFARVICQIWPEDERPRILFLDEPLTYLDVKYQYDFLNRMRNFLKSQNICIVGVLHDLNLSTRFADNLLLMHQGRLLAHGSVEGVLTADNIERMYMLRPQFIAGEHGRYIEF